MKVYRNLEAFQNVNNPVLTTGTFDGVHIGHQKIIQQINDVAKQVGGESVLLTFHPHPRMVLFPNDSIKLISTQQEKIERLEAAGLDHLIIYPFSFDFSRLNYVEYVRNILVNGIGVKHLVIGYDHQFGRNREGSYEQLEELAPLYEFKLQEIPAQTIDDVNISSTKIRRAIQSGDMETVTNYLGYRFSLQGMVVDGNRLGRTIGFPTANIQVLDENKIIPGNGVYAVNVRHMNASYQGMMNIGERPTISGEKTLSLEVNIFDFSEEIYGDLIEIEFVKRIRDEQKFDGTESLAQQLQEDKNICLNVL